MNDAKVSEDIHEAVAAGEITLEEAEELAVEEVEPEVTLFDAVEQMAATIMRISKKTKMSETGVLNIFSFQWQQIEQARMQAQQAEMKSGQDMVDEIAEEVRMADEEITGE